MDFHAIRDTYLVLTSILHENVCARPERSTDRAYFSLMVFGHVNMVCGYLIEIVALVLFKSMDTSAMALAAPFETVCDRNVYGLPDYHSCSSLLFGRDGVAKLDNAEHGFLLPYFGKKKQFTDWQWRQRVYLPEVWRNRKSPLPCYSLRKDF